MKQTTKNKQLRAAIYIRVSTEDQRKGYGLDYQLEDTKRAAVERDGCIVKKEHIFDDSKSGSDDNRPGWQKLMEMARKKDFDVVYFWKLDRMMRSERHFYRNEERLNELNIELRFATQDLQDPFTRAIQVAVAAEERRKILERTKRGREMAARAGKWVMGKPPYGYKLNESTKKVELAPEEAKWVKNFYEWLVYESCNLREIARRANALNVPMWADNRKTNRKSRMWWPRTLGRILTNETFTGVTYFRKHKFRSRGLSPWFDSSLLNEKDTWIRIEVPPIVSRELFEAGLRRLKKNREFALRKAKREYLFSKILFCGMCGYKLKGQFKLSKTPNGISTRNYTGRAVPLHKDNSKRCPYCGWVSESRMEPIWNALKIILKDPSFIYDKLQSYTKKGIGIERYDERLEVIEKELELLVKKQDKLNIAFLDNSAINENEYKRRLQSIYAARDKLVNERLKLKQSKLTNDERNKRTRAIQQLYESINKNIETASYEARSKIIHRCIERINLYLGKNLAEVVFNFNPEVLQDNRGDTCPAKNFTLTVNIPLISTKEWQDLAGILHLEDPKHYREKELAVIANLALQKAKQMYL